MAATTITPDSLPAAHSAAGQVLTATACDVANGNDVAIPAGKQLLLTAHNTGGSPYDFEVTSQPDTIFGRTGDIAVELAAGERRVFRLTRNGWVDGNGKLYFLAEYAAIVVTAVLW